MPSPQPSTTAGAVRRVGAIRAFRVASILLVVFGMAHTNGGLLSSRSFGVAGDAVLMSMRTVHFDFNGANRTFYDFYLGSGLMTSVWLFFSAVLTWHLGSANILRLELRPVVACLFVAHLATTILSWTFFFSAPGVFSTSITALIGWEYAKLANLSPVPHTPSKAA